MSVIKIGLFGGTFDPVHLGHVQMAKAAMEEFGLDRIVFIPSAQPPHKDKNRISSFTHRVAMLDIVCNTETDFEYSTIEGTLPAPSYTIDTLMALFEQYSSGIHLYFIIGTDAFLDITTWKAHEDILKLLNVIIARRQGADDSSLTDFLSRLGYSARGNCWQAKRGLKDIYFLQTVPRAISSSSIREKIMVGDDFQGVIPKNVVDYIQSHKLYSSTRESSL